MSKILFVTEYYPPNIQGGGEISCEMLAENLSMKGNQVTVLTSFDKDLPICNWGDALSVVRILDTGSSPTGILNNFKRITALSKSVKKHVKKLDKTNSFDVIHCYNGTTTVGVSKCGFNDKKIFATINSYIHLCPKGTLLKPDDKLCNGCRTFSECNKCMGETDIIGKFAVNSLVKNVFFYRFLYAVYKQRKKSLYNIRLLARSIFIKKILELNNVSKYPVNIEYPLMRTE